MTDVTVRLLQSSLIIQGKTILPHIEATKRILKGDSELLEKTLLADEFDILTDSPKRFNCYFRFKFPTLSGLKRPTCFF